MGSWIVYGLGAETESLPAYVVMPDARGAQEAGVLARGQVVFEQSFTEDRVKFKIDQYELDKMAQDARAGKKDAARKLQERRHGGASR